MEYEEEEEDVIPQRSLRRAQDRAAERKKRKEKAEIEKANRPTKEAKQLEKVLKKVQTLHDKIKQCDSVIAICDNDLRESDCHRTRMLGKDRFWNRYYWYERNAMPYGGLPDSSTAEAEYANGRLWVQGPDDMERKGFIDLSGAVLTDFCNMHDMTPYERKLREEGPTHTFTATQWGYYDEPHEVDGLIQWLSEKGIRENKLRKELLSQKEHIVTSMEKRKLYLGNGVKEEDPSEPVARISTRTKTYVDPSGRRHMKWRNTAASRELGHLHSEPMKSSRRGNVKANGAKRGREVRDEGRPSRGINRQGKAATRQGTRYTL